MRGTFRRPVLPPPQRPFQGVAQAVALAARELQLRPSQAAAQTDGVIAFHVKGVRPGWRSAYFRRRPLTVTIMTSTASSTLPSALSQAFSRASNAFCTSDSFHDLRFPGGFDLLEVAGQFLKIALVQNPRPPHLAGLGAPCRYRIPDGLIGFVE